MTPGEHETPVIVLARRLREAFGARAIEVATRQRDLAEPDIARTWDAILALLRSEGRPETDD